MNMTFEIPYVYEYIPQLCRQQAQAVDNHENSYIRNIEQGKDQHRKYMRIQLG
jgi:hypothetical protein